MDFKQKILPVINELRHFRDIEYSDIPDMEMYMDQMLSFLNHRLEPYKHDLNEKIFTKPMINNYTKAQLLLPPKNKKYNKEHIILLALIFQLKNIFSVNDIQCLFGPMLKDMSTSEDDVMPIKDIYSCYLELKNAYWEELNDHLSKKIEFINKKTEFIEPGSNRRTSELFLLLLTLAAQANAAKRIGEIFIDMYFSSKDDSSTVVM
jgi:Domain of unknown function (DUF1836).